MFEPEMHRLSIPLDLGFSFQWIGVHTLSLKLETIQYHRLYGTSGRSNRTVPVLQVVGRELSTGSIPGPAHVEDRFIVPLPVLVQRQGGIFDNDIPIIKCKLGRDMYHVARTKFFFVHDGTC